ncbi:MAG: hypothetical protein ACK4UN_04245 [Limisphaerales bacterium]
MSEMESIRSAVQRASQRRRWQRAWLGGWHGLLVGAAVWLSLFLAYKVFPISFQLVVGAGMVGIACVLVGLIYGYFRRLTAQETARWLDEKTHLQERLSTALELSEKPVDANWKQLLISDAAQHAQKIDLRKLAPLYLPKASRWALLLLAIGAGLGFVPEYRSKAYLEREKEKEVMREVGAKLTELSRRDLQSRPPALEPVRESLQSIEELGHTLQKANLSRTDALKDLASVTDRLKNELKDLSQNPGLKRLERAAREGNRAGANSMSSLQKQIDQMQKSLGPNAGNPDAMEKMKNDLAQAQKAAAGMPSKDSPEGQAARQQMAQNLANIAQQAREMGMPLPDLEAAIAALQSDQTDLFMKDLNAALTDLEKLQEMSKALQQLQNAAAKMGKDLAEQLKNGQAEIAQETLEKMIQQLKAANLTPEQLEKILQEVAKAIDPASEYGKVGECLSKACKQMKAGEKADAAKSLAEAADELKKLIEQMNGAEQLIASLEQLRIAQMCIGNCQGWGVCSKPGFSPGGKPGRGVGTWADDTGWIQIPENAQGWDNSGIYRPDMDGRGHTEREIDLPEGMTPSKIRGQVSPGGPMPSITLKGVSIKGQSSVEYTEAVSAAQSEAQSAINQDQVPRAYRGAVRDYFDDLRDQ